SHINDIVPISKKLDGPISGNFVQWNLTVGQVYRPPLDFNFDLGFPGLGLELDGGLDFKLGWSLSLGLGVSIKDGAYIEITKSNNSDDPLSHTFPNGTGFVGPLAPPAKHDSFEDISPNNSDLDTNGSPNGASGGRVNGLASVPGTNTTFYAASEWGGIYKS